MRSIGSTTPPLPQNDPWKQFRNDAYWTVVAIVGNFRKLDPKSPQINEDFISLAKDSLDILNSLKSSAYCTEDVRFLIDSSMNEMVRASDLVATRQYHTIEDMIGSAVSYLYYTQEYLNDNGS